MTTADASGNTPYLDFGPIEPNLDDFLDLTCLDFEPEEHNLDVFLDLKDCNTCYFRQATLERIRHDVKKLNGGD